MAGETVKTEALCLDIRPWSQTSHVVTWLTPTGKVATVVKGAVRPKSPFLGQYDLNYTCEILYYARGKGDVHALRECAPLNIRESLRGDYRALALAGYFRSLVGALAPTGEECGAWYGLLARALGGNFVDPVRELIIFELEVLKLAGLAPDFAGYDRQAEWSAFGIEAGSFVPADDGRQIRVAREVSQFLENPHMTVENPKIPLDAARVIGVFYQFHVDCAFETRRAVLKLIS